MKVELFAHPVSFAAAPGAQAERIAAAGVSRVRLAHTYHSGRWLLGTSAPGSVADLDAGRWFAARSLDQHDGGPIPALVDDLTPSATRALTATGVAVTAWLVGLHSSELGSRFPHLALHNAFGHRYRHALCPAQPEVRQAAAQVCAAVAAQPGVSGLELEAFSFLGFTHGGAHEKLGVALRPVDRWLLSVCFCAACRALFAAAGVDADEVAERIRAAVTDQIDNARPASPDLAADLAAVLGTDVHDRVLAVRAGAVRALLAAVVEAATVDVSIRATRDPYHVGGKVAGDLGAVAGYGGITVTDLGGDLTALQHDLAAARRHSSRITAGWSLAVQHTPDRRTLRHLQAIAEAGGAQSLAYYAYDLTSAGRLHWLQDVPSAAVA